MACFTSFLALFNVIELVTCHIGTGRPRGKVVGGVYIRNPKKTVDPGQKRKRRNRRDQGAWRRSAIGPMDPYARTAMQAVLPSAAYPPRDPRRKSRFLGHVIDGTLGWATDVVHHVPLVGPLAGHPLRLVCRCVRAGEDAINAITGTVGIHLFLIALLGLLPVGGAVSNCCTPDDVVFCTELTCMHETGCTICQQDGNQTICWPPGGIMISRHPNYTGVDQFLTDHIDFVAGTVFVCDLAGIREICGAAVLTASTIISWLPQPVTLNTTADCFLLIESGVDPTFTSFFKWIAKEVSIVTSLIDFIAKIPIALAHAFTQNHIIVMASIAGLAMNGNTVKAVALAVLYIEAAAAAPISKPVVIPSWNASCNLFGPIAQCSEIPINATKSFCLGPEVGLVEYKGHRVPGAWFCFGWRMTELKTGPLHEFVCCTERRRPSFCNNCSTDCSWADKRQTFEVCGATPVLSTACLKEAHNALAKVLPTLPPSEGVIRRDCVPVPVAYLLVPGWRLTGLDIYRTAFSTYTAVYFLANSTRLNTLPYTDWARMPGTPMAYRRNWMIVPKGMYSDKRDISSGLIMKDINDESYQMLFSGWGTYIVPGITLHVTIIALLAALGARWCLLIYAIFSILPHAFAFTPELVAATAASPWDDWFVRACVYVAVLWRRRLSLPLSGCFVGFLLAFVDSAYGYTFTDVAFAAVGVTFLSAWLGLFSRYVPWLILTQSYLRTRLEIAAHRWLDRSVLFISVILVPNAVWNTCVFLWICWLMLVAIGGASVQVFGPKNKAHLHKMLQRCSILKAKWRELAKKICLWLGAERGVFWFQHKDGDVNVDWEFKDPYFPFETEVAVAEDTGRKLACGDAIRGLPVYARCGTSVRAGISQLPKGWKRTIPFSLKTTIQRNQLRCLAITVTGTDTAEIRGSIVIMGTPLRSWMGFGCKGTLYTVHHGSKGRIIATDNGTAQPLLMNKDRDIVKYPLPKGMTTLEPCNCSCTEFYLATRLGNLIPVVRANDRFVNTAPLHLKEAKGSSGAPIICKCQKVKAMLISCRSSRGVVSSLGVVEITAHQEEDTRVPEQKELTVPPVAKDEKRIENIVAPTGSGKTTKLPMEYYKNGYRVLVLNPSVATTRNVAKYMQQAYGVHPNVRTGDHVEDHASRLTYSTYGMFLTRPQLDVDVVICDEVHSVDATTVLGIGAALHAFRSSPVAKLLILATATPPGTPIQVHPNITTIDLTDEGDVPYCGKKIKLENIRTGRHLIFLPSKSGCDKMAAELSAQGIRAMAYYRGVDASTIPNEGDLVIIATDALMTGYTGNFDSVYDSCLSVIPTYELTMNPTIQLGIRTMNSDTVTRMQRRGRTGRGRHGTYYQVTPHSIALGTVPPACIVECFDSGIAYFGMTPAEVNTFLSYYKEQPITPAIDIKTEELTHFFGTLGYVEPCYVEMMKVRADNYTFLYAAQYQLAKAEKAMAPNNDPIWKGLTGTAKFPLLYDLQEYDPEKVEIHATAHRLSASFEEYSASTGMTVAGVGLAVAAVFAAADMLGHIHIKQAFKITEDTSAARVVPLPETDASEQLEECFTWDGFAAQVNTAANWLGTKMVELGVKVGGKVPPNITVETVLPHLLAGIQYLAGLAVLQDAPGLGAVLGFVGGMLSPLPLPANLFLSTLGGAFATRLTTQSGAAVFALAGALGSIAGQQQLGSVVGNIFATYGSATASCLVVLKLIDGQWPEFSEWTSLAMSFAAPGATIVGAGAALAIAFCTRTESQVWMNRLLAMLHRGASCENYFVNATTLRTSVIRCLERANLWALFKELASWMNRSDEDLCSPRAYFAEMYQAVGRLMRLIVEVARGVIRRVATIPSLPWVGCDRGYGGQWAGSGILHALCGCGGESTWNVQNGTATWVNGPRTCCSYWTGRVPVNSALSGTPRPRPVTWNTMAVNTGFNTYVTYERRGEDVYVTGVSSPDQIVDAICPELLSAVAVDGVQVKPFGGTDWRKVGPFTARLRRGKQINQLQIPFKLEPTKEPFREIPCPSPSTIALVGQTERCVSLARVSSLDGGSAGKKKKPLPSISDDGCGADLMRSLAKGVQKLEEIKLAPDPKPSEPKSESEPSVDGSTNLLLHPRKKKNKVKNMNPLPRLRLPVPKPKPDNKVTISALVHPEPSTSGLQLVPPKPPESLHSSSWETTESQEHSCSSWSYDWAVPTLVFKGLKKVRAAVSSYTAGILRYQPMAYTNKPESINERVKKVTIKRTRDEFPELTEAIMKAKIKARELKAHEITIDQALAQTHNRTAKSAITGVTARMLKNGHTALVHEIYDGLEDGKLPSPWNEVNLMPKQETFVRTPQKPSEKPCRIVAYPHLETRVVEKMVLGEIGPAVVKAVVGDAYGFVPPRERIQKLLAMWRRKRKPGGFTCDTVCFDSTITPEDVAAECAIYCEGAAADITKKRITTLHNSLYAGGPMVMQGTYVGERHCRASGVFTTSSSNTMTCYLKVTAAAKKAGIKNPEFLICGDDTVCIFESRDEEDDKRRLGLFAQYMKQMGAPQGEVPRPHYHLELLDSCSSNVSVAQTPHGLYHHITRDPRIPLGRMSMEGKGYNPLGCMLGYIIAHYPALWVSRIVCVKFLQELLATETLHGRTISFDWYGNDFAIPVNQIPYIIESLHGKECWSIRSYTSREISRVQLALKETTIRPLRYYKRTARSVVTNCRMRGGIYKFLGDTLLSWVHQNKVNLDPRKVQAAKGFNPFEPYNQNIYQDRDKPTLPWLLITLAFLGAAVIATVALGG
nr:polyprotein [Rodent hepacivirus]